MMVAAMAVGLIITMTTTIIMLMKVLRKVV
jgi:hypothetical protein